jgi:hypothetical protein
VLKVVSDERTWGSVIINTHFSQALPVLAFTPNHVETGVVYDGTVNETVTLQNKGLADMTGIRLSLGCGHGAVRVKVYCCLRGGGKDQNGPLLLLGEAFRRWQQYN